MWLCRTNVLYATQYMSSYLVPLIRPGGIGLAVLGGVGPRHAVLAGRAVGGAAARRAQQRRHLSTHCTSSISQATLENTRLPGHQGIKHTRVEGYRGPGSKTAIEGTGFSPEPGTPPHSIQGRSHLMISHPHESVLKAPDYRLDLPSHYIKVS